MAVSRTPLSFSYLLSSITETRTYKGLGSSSPSKKSDLLPIF